MTDRTTVVYVSGPISKFHPTADSINFHVDLPYEIGRGAKRIQLSRLAIKGLPSEQKGRITYLLLEGVRSCIVNKGLLPVLASFIAPLEENLVVSVESGPKVELLPGQVPFKTLCLSLRSETDWLSVKDCEISFRLSLLY
jgi:hypothetical protein